MDASIKSSLYTYQQMFLFSSVSEAIIGPVAISIYCSSTSEFLSLFGGVDYNVYTPTRNLYYNNFVNAKFTTGLANQEEIT